MLFPGDVEQVARAAKKRQQEKGEDGERAWLAAIQVAAVKVLDRTLTDREVEQVRQAPGQPPGRSGA